MRGTQATLRICVLCIRVEERYNVICETRYPARTVTICLIYRIDVPRNHDNLLCIRTINASLTSGRCTCTCTRVYNERKYIYKISYSRKAALSSDFVYCIYHSLLQLLEESSGSTRSFPRNKRRNERERDMVSLSFICICMYINIIN